MLFLRLSPPFSLDPLRVRRRRITSERILFVEKKDKRGKDPSLRPPPPSLPQFPCDDRYSRERGPLRIYVFSSEKGKNGCA